MPRGIAAIGTIQAMVNASIRLTFAKRNLFHYFISLCHNSFLSSWGLLIELIIHSAKGLTGVLRVDLSVFLLAFYPSMMPLQRLEYVASMEKAQAYIYGKTKYVRLRAGNPHHD